jgi:hypothetical protein
MRDAFTQAMINFVAVFGGLFVLWTFVMSNRMSTNVRVAAAALAGFVSAAVTFAFAAAT